MIFFRDFLPNCSYISEGREFGAPKLPKMFVFDLTKNDVLDLADYQYIMSRIMEARKVDIIFSRLSTYYVEDYGSAQGGLSV